MAEKVLINLATGLEDPERERLERYAAGGLTVTKAVQWPADLQVYGRETTPDGTRYLAGGQPMFFVAPFALTPADLAAMESAF